MLVVSQGFAASREIISSDEMGLISLGVAALAFRQIVATEAESWNLCWVMLGPVATTLAITTWASLTTSGSRFHERVQLRGHRRVRAQPDLGDARAGDPPPRCWPSNGAAPSTSSCWEVWGCG